MLDNRKTYYTDGSYYLALECTHVNCPKCGIIVAIKVGLDAHMHDLVRFQCPECIESSVAPVTSRGTWTSPGHGPTIVAGVQVNDEHKQNYGAHQ